MAGPPCVPQPQPPPASAPGFSAPVLPEPPVAPAPALPPLELAPLEPVAPALPVDEPVPDDAELPVPPVEPLPLPLPELEPLAVELFEPPEPEPEPELELDDVLELELDDVLGLGTHVPVWQLPPGQAVPSGAAGSEHSPVAAVQLPATWHASLAVQETLESAVQAPDWQLALRVHASPSVQDEPSGSAA